MPSKGVASFVAVLTPILGLFAFWPSIEPAARWFVETSALILLRPQVQAVLTSIAIGVLLGGFLPHLPWVQAWKPDTTKALTRLLCVLVTGVSCYLLTDPHTAFEQRTALIYATLAALASSATWTTLAGLLYRVKARPESLK